MKSRVLRPAARLRSARLASPSTSTPRLTLSARAASSLSQKPNANHVSFPGAVKSAFTHTLKYETPSDYPALSTYRVVDQDGIVVDESFKPDLSDEEVIKLYKDMVYISIMDLIMFDAQRQGRLSFYMVSAGEEALSVGSASVLAPEDVVFCQYREQGVFKQRGFTTSDFMSQLFANAKDPGRGRNMPVHYGSKELNIVSLHLLAVGDAAPAGLGGGVRAQDAAPARPQHPAARRGGVLWRGRRQRGRLPRGAQHGGDAVVSGTLHLPQQRVRHLDADAGPVPGRRHREPRPRVRHRHSAGGRQRLLGGARGDQAARAMHCRDGGRPVLIDVSCQSHSTSDDSFAYRARVEVEDWKRRDNPITRLRKWMEARGIWDEGKEKTCRDETRSEVLKGFREAEAMKKPPMRSMFEDVYEELTPDLKQQMAQLKAHLEKYPEEYDCSEFEGGADSLKP
ncbi:2-oxoisovalerate dehydrogenase subunit alpha [Verticillium alfalfae VaMs.102]|uniref:2-oxoisovalerate dehydrogenase subunit alpha n=1 Tax=Verticillium alfalfae (strain VaMs.102 / ATCC MYA-4576 / FGSC 10136) TaxID=526221 RepID=C9SSN4_VERA1|nr:2-oxoisovalerate dehydrogenase subunit alpha [Verticillium alfalfae VaMs.102]EEY21799.1 2-oxoisovalerate dehydrogenase subunit alpha [Verticillium alfalfae VaMs.102]